MHLNTIQTLVVILVTAFGIQTTRWLPFLLFPENKEPPAWVTYLGHVLPPAMMGLLVVYCLKGVHLLSAPYGLPEAIAIAAVAIVHRLWGNVLVSVGGGTVLYMILVQIVFA